MITGFIQMRKFSLNTITAMASLVFVTHCVVAAPAQPVVTVSNDKTRVVARYGVAENAERQSKLAVKELSLLMKKYPDAREWAVAYNTTPELWRVLEYDIERRQIMQVTLEESAKSNRRGNNFYPAHIHRAAQESLSIEALWEMNPRIRP